GGGPPLRPCEGNTAAAVSRRTGRRVAEREEHTAAIGVEPEDLERTDVQIDGAESHEWDHAPGARTHVVALLGKWPDSRALGETRVVPVIRQAAKARALRLEHRRLRMRLEELVAAV